MVSNPPVVVTVATSDGPVVSTVTGESGVIFCAAEKAVYTPLSEENRAFTHLGFVFSVIIFAGEILSK